MHSILQPKIQTREIVDGDIPHVSQLLARGLGYPLEYYLRVLQRLKEHPTPKGFPKYGYALEVDGKLLGVILLIFSTIRPGVTRCHVASWCVEPAYRAYASLFILKGLNHPDVTYLNVSARPSTIPIIEAQGFSKYSNGQFVAVPILNFARGERTKIVKVPSIPDAPFESFEQDLLTAHANFGCMSVWCVTPTRAYPFVFQSRFFKGFLPGVQLIYCRNIDNFVRFAGPIGCFLASRGKLLVSIDLNGPIAGLVGRYFDGIHPRYYKGPKPALGDLAYTQAVIAGFLRQKATAWWAFGREPL